MESTSPARIVHKYRYLDAKTGRWKITRHHMNADEAATFFAPGRDPYFKASQWEPVKCTREDRGQGHPMHGPGINCKQPETPREQPGRLTLDEIRAIWERNKCEDVRRLMWEIWYLREVVERARYVAEITFAAGSFPPFDDRLTSLQIALGGHPSPAPMQWSSVEVIALKRLEIEGR
ncbi:hypothetical protein ACI2VR_07000 [Ralstonia nicotianae]